MKGISPMIATVLLVGFTVAVGAILSVWFTTYTKTQTAGVGSATACSLTTLDVKVPVLSTTGTATVLITNNGPSTVNITSVVVACGNIVNTTPSTPSNTPLIQNMGAGTSQKFDVTGLTGCPTDYSNIKVDVRAVCKDGGVTSGGCSDESCKY